MDKPTIEEMVEAVEYYEGSARRAGDAFEKYDDPENAAEARAFADALRATAAILRALSAPDDETLDRMAAEMDGMAANVYASYSARWRQYRRSIVCAALAAMTEQVPASNETRENLDTGAQVQDRLDVGAWSYDMDAAPKGRKLEVSVQHAPEIVQVQRAIRTLNGTWTPINVDLIYAWRPLPAPAPLPQEAR